MGRDYCSRQFSLQCWMPTLDGQPGRNNSSSWRGQFFARRSCSNGCVRYHPRPPGPMFKARAESMPVAKMAAYRPVESLPITYHLITVLTSSSSRGSRALTYLTQTPSSPMHSGIYFYNARTLAACTLGGAIIIALSQSQIFDMMSSTAVSPTHAYIFRWIASSLDLAPAESSSEQQQ